MEKNRRSANHEQYHSDSRRLSSQAKIIAALVKKQPQKPPDLCKNAATSLSTFYRIRRLLKNEGILKETPKGYSLWNYVEVASLWDRVRQRLLAAGGPLVGLKIEKLELGEQDRITGWYEKVYDKLLPVQGVIILRGAKELETAASLYVPRECLGLLLTQGNVEEGDRFSWRGTTYVIQEIERIIDGYEIGYKIAKLVERYHNP